MLIFESVWGGVLTLNPRVHGSGKYFESHVNPIYRSHNIEKICNMGFCQRVRAGCFDPSTDEHGVICVTSHTNNILPWKST